MSKYHNLPDIDTAPDVFETADEPDPPLRPSNEGTAEDDVPKAKSELIDQSSLPARRGVERAFGRTRRKDGTYQLGLPPLSQTHSSSSSSDEGPSRPRETPASRIRRLKAELAEVEKEVQDSGPSAASSSGDTQGRTKRRSVLPPKEPLDLVGELTGLRERLAVLDEGGRGSVGGTEGRDSGLVVRLKALKVHDRRVEGAGEGEAEAVEVEDIGIGGEFSGKGDKDSDLTDLDRRLASLEEMVGTTGEGVDQTASSPLLPSLSKLDHLLTLLTSPRHLDLLSRRLKLLLVDLDRAAASSRRTGSSAPAPTSTSSLALSTADHTQLITLFNLLPRLDPLLPILPPLLGRLRSLAALHREAGDIVLGLKKLDEGEKGRQEDVMELKKAVEGVQKGLEESAGRAEKNWEAVQARIRGLEERVKKLAE